MEFYIIGLIIGLILGKDSTPVDPEVAAQNQATLHAWMTNAKEFMLGPGMLIVMVVLSLVLALVMYVRLFKPTWK